MCNRCAIWVILLAASVIAVPVDRRAMAALPSAAAPAEDNPNLRRDQKAAATARAVELLRAQIGREPIGRNITVQNLLDKTGGADYLVAVLQRAEQIGGARGGGGGGARPNPPGHFRPRAPP